jgi:hypothetical protein
VRAAAARNRSETGRRGEYSRIGSDNVRAFELGPHEGVVPGAALHAPMQHQASSTSSPPPRAADSSLDHLARSALPRRRSHLRACPPTPTPDLPATSTLQPSRRRWAQRRDSTASAVGSGAGGGRELIARGGARREKGARRRDEMKGKRLGGWEEQGRVRAPQSKPIAEGTQPAAVLAPPDAAGSEIRATWTTEMDPTRVSSPRWEACG